MAGAQVLEWMDGRMGGWMGGSRMNERMDGW